jgi:hypothetical protein
MLNLIPVVVFLLMQGVGGESLTLRQQQALLDLAQRTHSVQSQREIGEALAQSGVQPSQLALLLQLFAEVGPAPALTPVNKAVQVPEAPSVRTSPGQGDAVRPRDGPVVF